MAGHWISVPEGCRLAKRGYSVLWRLVLLGELRSQRQGARLLVHRGDVLRLARRWRECDRANVGATG